MITDFDNKGILSESLKVGKPPLYTQSNLVKGLVINNTGSSIGLIKNDKIISTIVGDLIVVVDKNKGDVIVVNENFLEYINLDDNGVQTPQGNPIAHNYGTIEKMRIDKNSNFLLIISKYDNSSKFSISHKLHILNRKTLEEIQSFDNVVDILQIDNKNDVTCVGKDGKLISICTNFDQFPVGFVEDGTIGKKQITEIKNVAQTQLENVLSNGGIKIDMKELKNSKAKNGNGKDKNHESVTKLWETKVGEKTLRQLLNEADSEEKIEIVSNALFYIKYDPMVSAVSGITDSMEVEINNKIFEIKLKTLKENLKTISNTFEQIKNSDKNESYKYFPTLISLQLQLNELKKSRSQIPHLDEDLDKNISEISLAIDSEILNFRTKNEGEIVTTIDNNFEKIKTFLDSIYFLAQITQIYSTELYSQTEVLIDFLKNDKKSDYKNKLKSIISGRVSEIQALENAKKLEEENALKLQIKEIENNINELGKIIDSVEEEQNLDILMKTDALYVIIKKDLEKLPKSEAEKLYVSLKGLFIERKQKIRLKKLDSKGIIHSLDEYGIDTALYFSDRLKKQIGFKIMGIRNASGNIKLEINYDDGTIFNIDRYLQDSSKYSHAIAFDKIETEMTQKDFILLQKNLSSWQKSGKKKLEGLRKQFRETKEENEKKDILVQIKELKDNYLKARSIEVFAVNLANKLNLNPRSRLELPNTEFIVLDEERELLNKMSIAFDIQKSEQKGIDILEGPPGLGKTEICSFFAANTNREIARVQCSKMDPENLFFSSQLKAGETSRQPAEWIPLMKKPGTLILLDEIDKLNSQSFERLHSLFDGARAVYDPQFGWVKANPDCLFVGTRNSYEKMSIPIVSRSTIIMVKIPSELNEAFKISKYTGIEFFEKLSFEEFKKIFEGNIDNLNDASTLKIKEVIDYIKSLIKIFNFLRQKQISNNYQEKFEYEISYRDAKQIFGRFNKSQNVSFKDILLEILVPKVRAVVDESEEKDIQEKILKEIVEDNI